MTNIELGITTEFNISEIAYELYKQNWIDTHTTREMRLDALREYYLYRKECIEENLEIYSFEEWIYETGYDYNIYACYEEFCNEEYRDKDFMHSLLQNDYLIKLYKEDIL